LFGVRKTHTALHVACEHGQTAVVELLVERGADITKSVSPGTPPTGWLLDGGEREREPALGITDQGASSLFCIQTLRICSRS
jgi:ankyrin repeat protein